MSLPRYAVIGISFLAGVFVKTVAENLLEGSPVGCTYNDKGNVYQILDNNKLVRKQMRINEERQVCEPASFDIIADELPISTKAELSQHKYSLPKGFEFGY